MNSDPRAFNDETNRGSRRVAREPRRAPREEEELETGEPIPGEGEPMPAAKKIPARRGKFDAKPPVQTEPYGSRGGTGEGPPSGPTVPNGSGGGQMVLSSAKYLKTSPDQAETRRGKQNPCEPDQSDRSFEGRVLNGGVWGGLLAMAVAVIWFMAGLMNDVFFFYPPILFILGLVSFCKAPTRES